MQIPARLIADDAIIARHMSTAAKQAALQGAIHAFPVQFEDLAAGAGTTKVVTSEVLGAATLKKHSGGASAKGVVTDAPNNKCEMRDSTTNDPISDGSNRQVYGRIADVDTALTGTPTFNGTTAVTGSSTLFLTELSVGDWIKLDSDEEFRQVASITNDTALVLETAYPSSGSGASSSVVVTMSYFVDIAGTETAHTMASETIDVVFPEAFDLDDVPFNGYMAGAAFSETLPAGHSHDTQYYTETELDAGQLDSIYYTETELDGGQLDSRYYSESELDAGQLDNRYFTESEHLNTSAGAGDAGKPVKLDAAGLLNSNMLAAAVTDHGSQSGLGDDDHSQYHNDTRGDTRYFTQSQLGASTGTTGADRVGIDPTSIPGTSSTDVQTLLEGSISVRRHEVGNISAQNTIDDLTYTPRDNANVQCIVNGVPQTYGASNDFTVAAKVVTWYEANAGFDLETTDVIVFVYESSD